MTKYYVSTQFTTSKDFDDIQSLIPELEDIKKFEIEGVLHEGEVCEVFELNEETEDSKAIACYVAEKVIKDGKEEVSWVLKMNETGLSLPQ